MGCKYILKLQNGVEIALDSVFENRDDSLAAFKRSLEQQLLKDEQESKTTIEEIRERIANKLNVRHNGAAMTTESDINRNTDEEMKAFQS